jgi:hypothetical protein
MRRFSDGVATSAITLNADIFLRCNKRRSGPKATIVRGSKGAIPTTSIRPKQRSGAAGRTHIAKLPDLL